MLFDTSWKWPLWPNLEWLICPDFPDLSRIELPALELPALDLPTWDSFLSSLLTLELSSFLTVEVGLTIVGTVIVISLVSQRFQNPSSDEEEEEESPFIHTTSRSHCSTQFPLSPVSSTSQANSSTRVKKTPSTTSEHKRRMPSRRPPEFSHPLLMYTQPIPVLVHPRRASSEAEDLEKRKSLTDIRDTLNRREEILVHERDRIEWAARMTNRKNRSRETSITDLTLSQTDGHPVTGPQTAVENLPSGVDLESPILDDGRTPPLDLSIPDKILITIGLKKDPDPEARRKLIPRRPRISATRKYTQGGVGDPLKISPQFTSTTPLRQQHRVKRTEPVLSGYADQQMVIAAMRRRTLPTKIKSTSRSRSPSPDSRDLTSTFRKPRDGSHSPPQRRSRTPSPIREELLKNVRLEHPTAIPKHPTIKKDPVKLVPVAPRIPKLGKARPKEYNVAESRELLLLEIRGRKGAVGHMKRTMVAGGSESEDDDEVAPVKMGENTIG